VQVDITRYTASASEDVEVFPNDVLEHYAAFRTTAIASTTDRDSFFMLGVRLRD
jgi:hypothetical protein